MPDVNRQITLAARPIGFPKESDFKMVEAPVPPPGDDEVLMKVLYLSVDPYMRGRMSEAKSYAEPVKIGEPMVGGTVARVVESRNHMFRPGDIVESYLGWQEYGVANAKTLRRLDPDLAPISTALGVLGMPGMTAYFGLLDICHPQAGETVVVSGAAGAVGSVVGQIAKIVGCSAIGIAGGDDKIAYVTDELGFDGAFNYKTTADYAGKLKELCPNGIDVYFDNVGGEITDAVFRLLNNKARVSVCGQISQYNLEKPEMGARLLPILLVKQAKAQGFLVFSYAERFREALPQMAQWLKEGKIKYREEIAEGIENAVPAFLGMLQGKNIGKQLVRISPDA